MVKFKGLERAKMDDLTKQQIYDSMVQSVKQKVKFDYSVSGISRIARKISDLKVSNLPETNAKYTTEQYLKDKEKVFDSNGNWIALDISLFDENFKTMSVKDHKKKYDSFKKNVVYNANCSLHSSFRKQFFR
jgi:hypothetical protein